MTFKPGQSGNPGDCPKQIKEIQELARARSVEAHDALAAIVSDPEKPTAARVSPSWIAATASRRRIADSHPVFMSGNSASRTQRRGALRRNVSSGARPGGRPAAHVRLRFWRAPLG